MIVHCSVFSYIETSEAAGTPLSSLQDMFATEENAQIRDSAAEEIHLWAAKSGYKSLFQMFLTRRVNHEFTNESGGTVLHMAAAAGQETIVQ